MFDKILITFLVVNLLFAGTGGLLLGFTIYEQAHMKATPTVSNVAVNLILAHTPLTGGLINAIIIFITFLVSLPGLLLSTNKIWLRLHSYLVVASGITTLVIGLDIWFQTLRTRRNFASHWKLEPKEIQSLLQQKFNCCGYLSNPFLTDATCPNAFIAAQTQGCVGPLSSFANSFLDLIFTAMFGMVALDAILFLAGVVLLKSRAEKKRYRHIDEKNGWRGM